MSPSTKMAELGRLTPEQRGEEFRRLLYAEAAYVWKTLRRFGVSADDVEDVAHDVFVTAYRRWEDYDPSQPARGWLFGIAFRVAAAKRRLAHRRHEAIQEAPESTDPTPLADEQLESRDAARLVHEALEHVEMDRRAVLILHDLDNLAMRDIAAALEIPVNTAYSRLRLARADFKAALLRIRARRRRGLNDEA